MSLNGILNTALSGLLASQTALRTTSNNIANVNTEDYHRRDVQFGVRLTGSTLTGVSVEDIERITNKYLTQESISSTSAASAADVLSTYLSRVQDMMASLNGGASLQKQVSNAMSALSQLTSNPSSAAVRASALSAVGSALSAISSMSDQVQSLRQDANTQLTQGLDTTNTLLTQIYDLNTQIKRAFQNGDTSTGLLDQRDTLMAQLSKQLDVKTSEQADGRVFVSLSDGTQLISDLKAELRYNSPTSVTSATSFPSIMVQQTNPLNGNDVGAPRPLEGHVRGGAIRGLLDMRDSELPDLAEQLGAMAGGMAEQLNAAHNDSSAVPPPTTLTGINTGMLAGDALNMTGRATIAVVNTQGQLVQRLDIDFTSVSTVGDLVNVINSGLGGYGTASFNNGVLSITASSVGDGIAIKQDETDPSSRGGRGFAQAFGLNNLITSSSPSSFATGLTGGDANGFNAGGTTSFVLRGTDGSILKQFGITVGGATVGDIISDLNNAAGGSATFTLSADGTLLMTPASQGARLEVTNDTTSRGTTGVGLAQFFGLGTAMRANQASELAVRRDIAANGDLLSLAQLDISSTTAGGAVVLGKSDNRGALDLAAVGNASYAWPGAGGFAASTMSLNDFASRIVAVQSTLANAASSELTYRNDVQAEVLSRKTSAEGVNLDDELSNMMIYQQAYSASARMLTTVQQMYDTLLQAV